MEQTAANHKTPPLARQTELLGTIALHSTAVNQTDENPEFHISLIRVT
jgi:hypothetical protein